MFQPVDSQDHPQQQDHAARRAWMGALARADAALLERGLREVGLPDYVWLRRPETGLMMVRGRAGGTGERFNLGEMTVTRCALRLAAGESGVAYVPGRSHRKAELAALADALLQSPQSAAALRAALLEPLERELQERAERMQRKAQATRVEFFTVAREAGA